MYEDLWTTFMVFLVLSSISGTVLNLLIMIIYLQDWRQHRGVALCDQITVIMSFINVLLQFIITMDGMFHNFGLYPHLPKEFYLCVFIFIFFLIDIGSWHTTWLAITYYMKLVSVSHRFFIWLKSCFPSSAFPLLLGSVLGSFIINVPFFFTTRVELQEFAANQSDVEYTQVFHPTCILIHIIFGCCMPLIFTLICIGLSVKSLLAHVWRMRQSSSQYSFSPQTQALVQAAGTMILHVLLQLAFNLIVTGIVFTSFNMSLIMRTILWVFVMTYPTVQAIILIMGSARLKRRLFGREEPSSM